MAGNPIMTAGLARIGLAVLEPPYRTAVALRGAAFRVGLKSSVRLPRPTISVGNLTTGGTGKTPMVSEIVRRLEAAGDDATIKQRVSFCQALLCTAEFRNLD